MLCWTHCNPKHARKSGLWQQLPPSPPPGRSPPHSGLSVACAACCFSSHFVSWTTRLSCWKFPNCSPKDVWKVLVCNVLVPRLSSNPCKWRRGVCTYLTGRWLGAFVWCHSQQYNITARASRIFVLGQGEQHIMVCHSPCMPDWPASYGVE